MNLHDAIKTLEGLKSEIKDAQDWCDHNGDHGTGMVSLSVETLELWESELSNGMHYIYEQIAKEEDDLK